MNPHLRVAMVTYHGWIKFVLWMPPLGKRHKLRPPQPFSILPKYCGSKIILHTCMLLTCMCSYVHLFNLLERCDEPLPARRRVAMGDPCGRGRILERWQRSAATGLQQTLHRIRWEFSLKRSCRLFISFTLILLVFWQLFWFEIVSLELHYKDCFKKIRL